MIGIGERMENRGRGWLSVGLARLLRRSGKARERGLSRFSTLDLRWDNHRIVGDDRFEDGGFIRRARCSILGGRKSLFRRRSTEKRSLPVDLDATSVHVPSLQLVEGWHSSSLPGRCVRRVEWIHRILEYLFTRGRHLNGADEERKQTHQCLEKATLEHFDHPEGALEYTTDWREGLLLTAQWHFSMGYRRETRADCSSLPITPRPDTLLRAKSDFACSAAGCVSYLVFEQASSGASNGGILHLGRANVSTKRFEDEEKIIHHWQSEVIRERRGRKKRNGEVDCFIFLSASLEAATVKCQKKTTHQTTRERK